MSTPHYQPTEVIVDYVNSLQGRGHFLPYRDQEYIQKWLGLAGGDEDRLLLVLSEVLPPLYEKKSGKGPRLAAADKSVCAKLRIE